MRFKFQIIGTLGAVFAGVGGNMVGSDSAIQRQHGILLLIVGGFFGTGGLISIIYFFVRDWLAKLTAKIRSAHLSLEEIEPGYFCWRLSVALIITPPHDKGVLFSSDRIKARISGPSPFLWPLEITNMGISPLTNPRMFDGEYAELTAVREMGVFCDGNAYLTMTTGTLAPPKELSYDVELTDMSGDWSVVVESILYQNPTKTNEWGSFPDSDKPDKESVEIEIMKWIPFSIAATMFLTLVGWMAWSILWRHWL